MPIRQDSRTNKWFFRFRWKKRNYFRSGFRTAVQAKAAERIALDKVIQGELQPELAARDLLFQEVGTLFIENYSKKYKKSWDIDAGRIAIFSRFFQHKTVGEITSKSVEAFLQWVKKERGLKDHTLNHYLALLKCLFNWLRKSKKYKGENPACGIPMKKVERARVRFLYPSEEKILTPAISQDAVLWPYYMVGLNSGLRLSEIGQLRVRDIAIPGRMMFIAHSKTGRSRYVPMSEDLAEFLEDLVAGRNPDDRVMPNVCRWYISHRFRKLIRKVAILDLRFHDLRHTFAERLLSKGVPIYKVSKILGHSSVVTTEAHYGHLSMQDLKGAIDHIDGTVTPVAARLQRSPGQGTQKTAAL